MIHFFVNRPKLGVLLSLIIMLAGIFSLSSLRKEPFPNVNLAVAKITTVYPGATPEDVEELVTQKIEDELREIDGLKEVRSISQLGLSEVKIQVDIDNADVPKVMDELQRAAQRVTDLPVEVEDPPLFEEIKSQTFPILEISLFGDVDEIVLREEVDKLENIVETLPGVASVEKVGYRDREYRVWLDIQKLKQFHIGFDEVVKAIAARNLDLPGGTLESNLNEMTVRASGEVSDPQELLSTVIRTNTFGQYVQLKDIGKVIDSFAEPAVLTRTNMKPSMVLVVRKKEHADIITLAQVVKEKLSQFEKKLPQGIKIQISNDESQRTKDRLDIVINNTWIGLALVIVSLLLFLNWQMSIIASLSMPIVVMGTLIAMQALGITFNLISMLAIIIALGMFVDNSIVVSENIHRNLENGMPLNEATYQGVISIAWPVTATVLTTIAAFAPMLVTKGVMGEFIWGIPVLVTASLLICLAEAFFLLPSRIIVMERFKSSVDHTKENTEHWFEVVQEKFEKILRKIIKYKWTSIIIANVVLVLAFVWSAFMMDFILFPPEGVDRAIIKYEAKTGTSIEALHEGVKLIEKEIEKIPSTELDSFVTRTGIQQVDINDPLSRSGDNVGMITVYLTPENQRERKAKEILDELRSKIKLPEYFKNVNMQLLINGPPVGKPVTVTIYGDSLERLESITKEIMDYLGTLDGVFDIDTDFKPGLDQVLVSVSPEITQKYGISTAEVSRALRTAYEGIEASRVTLYGDEIDVRVQLDTPDRGNLKALENLPIEDGQGHLIPLKQVAQIKVGPGPGQRRHFGFLRAITVTADVKIDKITSVEANAKVRKKFKDFDIQNPGYKIKFGGEEENTQESMQSLASAMVIAILCIYTILVTLFNSLSRPMIVIFSIPFGFIGTIFGFSLHDKPLGFLAMIGVIGLAGVVVNAAIVMISFIDELVEDGMDFYEALIQGASMRLRPVLLTTITTVSALFPTAYGVGGWDPMLVPMTMALAWGLLFGTLITLFLVPCSYAVIRDFQDRVKNRFNFSK